jgi:hypothetical protein
MTKEIVDASPIFSAILASIPLGEEAQLLNAVMIVCLGITAGL